MTLNDVMAVNFALFHRNW